MGKREGQAVTITAAAATEYRERERERGREEERMTNNRLLVAVAAALCALLVLSVASDVDAVRYGHEHFADASNGMFAAFGDGFISFVDAETLSVMETIVEDHNGEPLVGQSNEPVSFADVIYMECPSPSGDGSLRSLIFANQRNVWTDEADVPTTDELFTNEPYSYVTVIDTDAMEIVGAVKVGPRPIHAYAVPWRNEFWTHPDGRAELDVIHCDDVFTTAAERIKANKDEAGHGKLLVHPELNNTAYATHTSEPYIFELDLETKKLIALHPIDEAEDCRGLHAVEYSPVNKHLYAECVGGGGIIEFDATTDTLVHQWLDETGAIYESPDGGFIVSANKAGNLFHVLQPQAGGEKSTKGFKDIMIPAPGSPIFYPNGQVRDEETGESFEDYLLFTPLINNPSRNFIECQYAEDGMTLATDANGDVITPNCGSCNEDPQYDGMLSGIAVFDLADLMPHDGDDSYDNVDINDIPEPELISAGGVEPTAPYPYSPECGYGRTYRKASRGGTRIATGADFDFDGEPALAIVDAEERALVGFVPMPSMPGSIAFVPYVKGLLPDLAVGSQNDE